MDGLLVVDKPAGPTSHDVVARVRRALGERQVGHTGTLDPAATGVLPLVLGRATRLARFLTAGAKSYDAVVRLGIVTNTYDAEGVPVGSPYDGPLPSRDAIEQTLAHFRGTFLQQPPAYSAKKIDGQRSYQLARRHARAVAATPLEPLEPLEPSAPLAPPEPLAPLEPVSVTVSALDVVGCEGDIVTLRLDCSAGFYVRSLAHDLGERLGTGAHLRALRRTRSGGVGLDTALPLDRIEQDPEQARRAMIPMSAMLTSLAAVTLTADGVRRALHGRDVGPNDMVLGVHGILGVPGVPGVPGVQMTVRLVDERGELVAMAVAASTPGLLHPSVVLM